MKDEVFRAAGYPAPAHPWAQPLVRIPQPFLLRRATFRGFPRYVPGGTALDVGCGSGAFLLVLQRYGWKVRGVEVTAAAAEAARSLGLDVHTGEITDDVFSPEEFDFIHMSHVIEHMSSPVTALRRVRELLRPGGVLYVETPNIASLGFKLWKRYWFPLESPRHLWLFTPRTLAQALRVAGFETGGVRTIPWRHMEWEETFRWEERHGQARPSRPAVQGLGRLRVAAASGLVRSSCHLRPLSGDILSYWAARPSDE
jgi:SAM-dependent methyltransferase